MPDKSEIYKILPIRYRLIIWSEGVQATLNKNLQTVLVEAADFIEKLENDLHYTKGCCDLAMKHRDQAEKDLESLLTVLEQKVEKWSEGKLIDEHADELRSLIEGYRNEAF